METVSKKERQNKKQDMRDGDMVGKTERKIQRERN